MSSTNLLAISINDTLGTRPNIYEAVRWSWKVSLKRAEKVALVLATYHGKVIGVFEPTEWFPATVERVPALATDPIGPRAGRYAFVGHEAPAKIAARYLGRFIERKRGAQNPIRYLHELA